MWPDPADLGKGKGEAALVDLVGGNQTRHPDRLGAALDGVLEDWVVEQAGEGRLDGASQRHQRLT